MTESRDRREGPSEASASYWQSYYDSLQPSLAAMRLESREYVRKLERLDLISSESTILDFGCGPGLIAKMLAPRVKKISLWDLSETMRGLALSHTAGCPNVTFLDLSTPRWGEVRQAFDVILVNSVVQYMDLEDFARWLSRWRQMLREGGKIVLSDIVPPGVNPFKDLGDMLGFWLQNRMASALMELPSKLIRYRQARRCQPLLMLERKTLEKLSQEAGLRIEFLPENLTHFKARITAIMSAVA
jgi:2-polyprenyl-3-methyl-5-hydroxy-6-metoxy-1,4-benzoquinol methylase